MATADRRASVTSINPGRLRPVTMRVRALQRWVRAQGTHVVRISFHGADRGVTGSCHRVEARGLRVLVDCGLYQGGRDLEEENAEPFGFDPAEIDVVLLTHAHLDHCGRLPILVRQGFRGEIVATSATRDLTRLVLLDAAHLQEEELVHRVRRAQRRHVREEPSGPLYSVSDALQTLERFVHPAPYGRPVALPGGARATFLDAGHILGSASVLLEIGEGSSRRALLFSGDLGNSGRPLLRDPAPPPDADVVVMETTYGDRDHRSLASSVDELHGAIAAAFARGGNVIIPTFALERAQELLFFIRQGVEQARIPAGTHVFLDSPMAISATDIFRHHPECYDEETRELFRLRDDPFAIPNLHFTRESSESMAINRIVSGAIILAGSGMCTGGRVRHHLRHQLGDERTAVIFVGYAAGGTLARQIIEGATSVRIHDEDIRVRARIHTINGFSAHAGQSELLAWHARTGDPQRTFLVHGEEAAMAAFAARLPKGAQMPRLHDTYPL